MPIRRQLFLTLFALPSSYEPWAPTDFITVRSAT